MSELLETISSRLGCEYLSDLKWVQDTELLKKVIVDLAPDKYSLQDWSDAINYLTNENVSPASAVDAKNYLLLKLSP